MIRDGRPILITGGAGFIGSNLADRLAGEGHKIIIYDALSRPGVERNLAWLIERHGYLSPSAVHEMTSRQTGTSIPESYGLGFATGGGSFGHGGAYATNMTVDPPHGLITIFLVQHAGWPNDGGKKVLPAFQKAAMEAFGK